MSLKHGLLGLLNYGSMTGYELDKAFKNSLAFFWQAKTSQIYRELDAMEKSGWLISERIIQTEKPNKRVYSLTGRGKEELAAWLAAPEPDISEAMYVKSAFLMRVFFAGETSKEEALKLLRQYRAECQESILGLSAADSAIEQHQTSANNEEKVAYWKMTVLYGKIYYQAGIEWTEQAITLLEDK